eukprot:CAMPEP_0203663648 /NCGR_PEP_ID=MMETSP0090-20130426/1214_1 /ASSEMBLY_ACC=CAM_ASM_001088 /TAXON_ID=426623 /ORGANISM="Chaetoceros affinis, Strain CCMP159" /LENGTH=693 /DNA_ID=CAMNT_0050526639 /DNA_START=499 /DNA_END=2580 /DNA_ORIENTATION=-
MNKHNSFKHEESPLLAKTTAEATATNTATSTATNTATTTATTSTKSGQTTTRGTTRLQIKPYKPKLKSMSMSMSMSKPKPKPRQPTKSTPYNVRSMLVHSPYIPARALNPNSKPKQRQKTNFYRKRRKAQGHGQHGHGQHGHGGQGYAHLHSQSQFGIDSGAESAGGGGGAEPTPANVNEYMDNDHYNYNYNNWVGRIGVHVMVQYFDLKLLVKDVFSKNHLLSSEKSESTSTFKWEVMEFDDADDDVIRLLPSMESQSHSTLLLSSESSPLEYNNPTVAADAAAATADASTATAFITTPTITADNKDNGRNVFDPTTTTTKTTNMRSIPLPFSSVTEESVVEALACTGLENISQLASLDIYSDEEEQIMMMKQPPLASQEGELVQGQGQGQGQEQGGLQLELQVEEHQVPMVEQQTGQPLPPPPLLPGNMEDSAVGPTASTPEVYIFSFGAIVFWNFENEEKELMWMDTYLFADNDQGSYYGNDDDDNNSDNNSDNDDIAIGERNHEDAIESAKDEMSFCYGNKFHLRHDMAQLRTREYGEKMAVSFALAKSANLSIFEWRLDQAIERNSHIPEKLATYGRIGMHRKDISREMGRIYLVKSGIHLENNILDTPVYFWEDDKFSNEYEKAMEYFDITSRLELVNTRLQVLSDLNEILIDAAQSSHGTFLEWTVIILIVFEILIEIFRAYRDEQ